MLCLASEAIILHNWIERTTCHAVFENLLYMLLIIAFISFLLGIKTSGMSDQMRSERKSDTSMRTPSPYGRSKSPVSRSLAVPKTPPDRKSPQPVASYQKARGSEDSARQDSDVIIVKEDLAKDKSRLEKERERRDARDSAAEQSFRSQEPMSAEQFRNLQLQQQLTLQQQYFQPFMQGGSMPLEMVKNLGQLAYLQGIADPKAALAAQWMQFVLEQEKQVHGCIIH